MRRIAKVQGAQHAGFFQGWSMDKQVEDFSRINLIYGGNGSGKSTLARLLSMVATQEQSDTVVHIDVRDGSSETRRITDGSDPFWSRLRVFDKQFVRRNLWFDVDGTSEARPLLVLGEPNIQRDQRIAAIDSRLEELSSELRRARQAAEDAEKAAKKLATDTARTISQELQAAGSHYSPRRYNARQVTGELNSITEGIHERSDQEMSDDLSIVQGEQLDVMPLLPTNKRGLEEIERAVIASLRQAITSTALQGLSEQPANESWVQAGLHLHKDLENCLFCANPITPDRRKALESHFDESFRRLQGELESLVQRLNQEDEAIRTLLASARNFGSLYKDLQGPYQKRLRQLMDTGEKYRERVSTLASKVAEKLAAPLSSVEVGAVPPVASIDFEPLNEIIERHNNRSSSYLQSVDAAARRVEKARLDSIAGEYHTHTEVAKAKYALAERLENEQATMETERMALSAADLNAAPLAEQLTRDVSTLLGRDELVFVGQQDRYSIQRNGKPATNLSEGEQTAISLLYFLSSLRDEKTSNVAATVVVDDPVSSLDHEILFGASSYLWSALVGNNSSHQLILLTHNFEFFRMWSNQLDRIKGHMKKLGGYSIYELRPRYQFSSEGPASRRPVMISWRDANLRKRLRSQYHYLFWRVASVVHTDSHGGDIALELEASTVIPNAARQMLEGFLAFKYPSKIGDFEGSMKKHLKAEQSLTRCGNE